MCRAALNHTTQILAWVRSIATPSDSVHVRLRSQLKIPYVSDPDSVKLVTSDSAVCNGAAAAYRSNVSTDPGLPEPVWVIAIGASRYLVWNSLHRSGGNDVMFIFDTDWTWISGLQ